MNIFANRGKDKKDNSLGLLHGEAATGSIENAGAAYQANTVIATGADAGTVALLSAAINITLSVLLIKVPSLAEGKHNLKRTTIIIAFINTLTWLPVVLALALFHRLNPYLLIFLWVLNLVPSILVGPLRDNWMSNLIPSEKMGRYLSWRSAIGSVFYLSTFIVMGLILDYTKTTGFQNFAIVTAISLLGALSSSILYTKISQSQLKTATTKQETFGFFTFLKETRRSHLGSFIIFMSLFSFAVNLSSPLLAAYMINSLNFSYMTYTAMISCEYIARIISLSFWGKQIDKSGTLSLMMKVAHLIPFVPILWMFSKNLFYLGAVQLFSGMVWAAFDLCAQTFMFKATPPQQRLRYISYQRSLTTFSVAVGAISGALLLKNMFPIFGSQILGVFLVSGILRLVVARVMLPRLQPGAIPDAVIHEELAIELAKLNMANSEGLYYHPEKWSRFTKPAVVFGTIIGKAVKKITPRPAGLYYNPQKWSNYMGNSVLQPIALQANDSEISKGGLYYDKKAWTEYMQQTSVLTDTAMKPVRDGLLYNPEAWASITKQSVLANARMSDRLKPVRKGLLYDPEAWARLTEKTATTEAKAIYSVKNARNGLFYDSQRWGDYLKQSLVLNATTMRTSSEGLINRQPIFYHPEMWNNYKNQSALSKSAIRANTNTISGRQALLYHPEEWNKTLDPVMVHIGRKSAIGTVITRQSQVKKIARKVMPAIRTAEITKRIRTAPSLA
jgi:MFS family permease